MNRSEHLEICQQCQHRKMDFKKGLLCGLSNKLADFEDNCPYFKVDVNADFYKKYVEGTKLEPLAINSYLIKLIIFGSIVSVVSSIVYEISSDFFYGSFFSFSVAICSHMAIWLYIGLTLNHVKTSLTAGAMGLSAFFILNNFPLLNEYTFWLVPVILPICFFAYQLIPDKKKRIQFMVIAAIISQGLAYLDYSPFQILLNLNSGSDRFLWDYQSVIQFFGNLIAKVVWLVTNGLLFVLAYQWINNKVKLNLKFVSLNNVLPVKKMGVFVFTFYGAILLLSYNVTNILFNVGEAVMTGHPRFETGLFYFISMFILFISCLSMLLFTSWYYRKITIEYFLGCHRKLSWAYFFAQVPIINIFVWAYILSEFKPTKADDKNKIEAIFKNKNQEIIFAAFAILLLKSFFTIVNPGIVPVDILIVVIDIVLLLLYINYQYGMHVIITLEICLHLPVLLMALFNYEIGISEKFVSFSIFYSIARLIIMYPVFHLKQFKILRSETNQEI